MTRDRLCGVVPTSRNLLLEREACADLSSSSQRRHRAQVSSVGVVVVGERVNGTLMVPPRGLTYISDSLMGK